MNILSFLAGLMTSFAVTAAASDSCALDRAVLMAPLRHPETAKPPEWHDSLVVLYRVMRSCPKGPADRENRDLLFDYVNSKLSLDYVHLCQVWTGGHAEDGCIGEDQQDLRDYLDRIVDPILDLRYADVILEHANGRAIAKLGRPVMDRVLAMAVTEPNHLRAGHDQQIAAITALGVWLAPNSDFTTGEKGEFLEAIRSVRPPGDKVAGGRPHTIVRACLQALAKTDSPAVRQLLLAWADVYEAKYLRAEDELPRIARKGAEAIAERHERRP